MKQRHVPQRSCVVCGNKTSKADLMRIVARPGGDVAVDPSGKEPGRGAYVCKDRGCLPEGLKRARLAHRLRTEVSDEAWAAITEYRWPEVGTARPDK